MSQNAHILHICSAFETLFALLSGLIQNFQTASKVAVSNHRIVKVENDRVFFRYKKTKSNRWRTMSLAVMEFMHRFLQHVLPSGFMKVRYYGFLSPGSSLEINDIIPLIEEACKIIAQNISISKTKAKTSILCYPDCKGGLIFKCFVPPMPSEYRIAPG